jgi:hypothetical protein
MPLVPAGSAEAILARASAGAFLERRVVIAPGARYRYESSEWVGALVFVERGVVDLEWSTGRGGGFAQGSTFWLSDLPLLALHAAGSEPVVLVVLKRHPRARRGSS